MSWAWQYIFAAVTKATGAEATADPSDGVADHALELGPSHEDQCTDTEAHRHVDDVVAAAALTGAKPAGATRSSCNTIFGLVNAALAPVAVSVDTARMECGLSAKYKVDGHTTLMWPCSSCGMPYLTR